MLRKILGPWTLLLFVLAFSALACDLSGSVANKPTVVISAPPSGSTYHEGEDVAVQSSSADNSGVNRVELVVDGIVVRTDPAPSPQANFSIIQTWKATQGTHTISVRAYNAAGASSDPAAVAVTVAAAPAAATTVPPTAAPATVSAAATATATATTAPTTTGAGGCTNVAAFVSDVSIPDGTTMNAGQTFNKTWRVKNTGTCAWTTGYDLAFVSGEAMTSNTTVALPATPAGGTADLTVAMTAPTASGTHMGQWRLRDTNDKYFGTTLTVNINVPGAQAPAQPTTPVPQAPTGCTGTPSIASFTTSTTLIFGSGPVTLNWGAVTNADSVEIDNGIGGVAAPGSTTVTVGQTTTFTLTAHCGSNTSTKQVTITKSIPVQIVTPFKVIPLFVFKVTSVSISKNIMSCSGGYTTTRFTGTIVANGAGDVTYAWTDDTKGGQQGSQTIHFSAEGMKSANPYIRSGYDTGDVTLQIISPNSMTSNTQTYARICN